MNIKAVPNRMAFLNESVIEEMKLVAEPIGHRVCRSDRNTTVASTGSATSKGSVTITE